MSASGGTPDDLDQALALANGSPAGAPPGLACADCPARGRTMAAEAGRPGAGNTSAGGAPPAGEPSTARLSAASPSTRGPHGPAAPGAPATDDEDLAPAWLLGSADGDAGADTPGRDSPSGEVRSPRPPNATDDDLAPAWLLNPSEREAGAASVEEGRLSGTVRALRRPGDAPAADDDLLPEWLVRTARRVGLNRPDRPGPADEPDPDDDLAAPWVPRVPSRPRPASGPPLPGLPGTPGNQAPARAQSAGDACAEVCVRAMNARQGAAGGGEPVRTEAGGGPARTAQPGERHDGGVTSRSAATGAGSGTPADVSEAPPSAGQPGRAQAADPAQPAPGHTSGDSPRSGRRARAAAPPRSHVTWDEAQRVAARAATPATAENVPLDRAVRQVLAAPVEALADLPSFDAAAMDGWAVAGPGPWVPADPPDGAGVLAGRVAAEPLADGCAVRIATGARMPDGATAVLRSERAELRDGRLRLAAGAPACGAEPGTDVRPRGQECRTGDRLLPAGTPVTPPVLGLAAAAGYDRLTVTPRPRAEVLVLGDELLHAGLPSGGRVRDALGPMVGPWLAALGAEVLVTRRLGDDAEALHEAVTTTTADLLVTTGGTAHGPVDHVRPTLHRIGARLLVDGVEVRPGHPMLLAALAGAQEGRHLVGLPGNPLAAVSGLLTLAAPLLRARAGLPEPEPVRATLTAEVPGHPRDTRLVPVTRSADGAGATPLRWTGPAMLRGIAGASALAAVPPGGAAAGTSVRLLELLW